MLYDHREYKNFFLKKTIKSVKSSTNVLHNVSSFEGCGSRLKLN